MLGPLVNLKAKASIIQSNGFVHNVVKGQGIVSMETLRLLE